ncbi:hypothetical protein Rxycam_00205 [Rubrobacter xylanophilus DSM 9941]|nr:hypothetical protein [Rubrobacter xylanophilus]QYJ14409.1 hypothetical protein Rxycam_00205 [Rubrobacter xylanophilus DSM 9941]
MTLRVANVRDEGELELVRDVLDELGAEYEYLGSEPEDSFPQTAYFELSSGLADDAEELLARLAADHGFDAEILD